MKYKVGDRVRMADNLFDIKKDDVCTIKRIDDDLFYFLDKEENVGMTKGIFSHLVISEITDELIDRFKKEKIAWYFKSKEDYGKILDILEDKGIEFTRWENFPIRRFDTHKVFCISVEKGVQFLISNGFDFFKNKGYEIIEIMNPVYVPINLKIDDEWIDIDVVRYVENNLEPQYKDYKKQYYYKNQNVEEMFQQYMQQKKIPDLDKKVENQRNEIVRLNQRIEQYQKQIVILLDDRSLYKSRLSVIKELCDED